MSRLRVGPLTISLTVLLCTACASGLSRAPAAAGAAASVDAEQATSCLAQGLPAIDAQKDNLGLLRPAREEYRLIRAARPGDRLVCTFQQVNRGVPVQFYEYAVHLSPQGRVLFSNGRYATAAAAASPQPGLTEIRILELAFTDAQRLLAAERPSISPPQLRFTAVSSDRFRLDFETVARHPDSGAAMRLGYDAENGRLVSQQRLGSGPAAP